MSLLEAFILGILQGLTEFLPVSSSGHIEIAKYLLNVNIKEDLLFTFILHLATVLSIIVVFYKDLREIFVNTLIKKDISTWSYVLKLIISSIPVVIIGLFFEDFVEQFFEGKILLVCMMLLVTAALLYIANVLSKKAYKDISFIDAFIVGISQAIAILPGISRSGATISTGLMLKIKKDEISKFAFLMLIIPVLGKIILDIGTGKLVNIDFEVMPLIVGSISAFLSGILACKLVINFVRKSKLIYFSIYCLIISLVTLFIYIIK